MAGLSARSYTVLAGAVGIAVFLAVASSWLVGDDSATQFEDFYRPTAMVREGPFRAWVTEEATLEARQSVILASDLPSNSAKVVYLAPEGVMVRPGDVVARFDPTEFREDILRIENDIRDEEANLAEAQAERLLQEIDEAEQAAKLQQQVELASIKLRGLREGDVSIRLARAQRHVEEARGDYEQASRRRATQEQLLGRGLTRAKTHEEAVDEENEKMSSLRLASQELKAMVEVTIPSELRQAEIQHDNRQSAHASFQESLQHRNNIHAAGISRARNRIVELKQELARAQLNVARTNIIAPVQGMLLYKPLNRRKENRKAQVGDSLWIRQGFAVIPDMTAMVAVLRVREIELGKLAIGQEARVEPQAFAELALIGRVESIGALVSDDGTDGGRYFNVRIALENTDSRLRPGMSARTAIQTSNLEQVVHVPVEAVFYEDAEPVCFRLQGGEARRVMVTLGVSDGHRVVVESGLAADEEVMLVYPGSAGA